jgi:hypothetical protein
MAPDRVSTVSTRVHGPADMSVQGEGLPLDTGHTSPDTAVLAEGWHAWVGDVLLGPCDPLVDLDPALVPHWIKRGWAVPAPRPEAL